MRLQGGTIARISLAAALFVIPKFVAAQGGEGTGGVPVQMTVTVEPKHGSEMPQIMKQDVIVNQGRDRRPVLDWIPAAGSGAGLQLAILIDDSAGFSFGSQMDDVRAFITEQPPTTLVAVGYMQNGTVFVAQDFTQDHAAAAKSLRLPQGYLGAEASPYFSLSAFVKKWPADPSFPPASPYGHRRYRYILRWRLP